MAMQASQPSAEVDQQKVQEILARFTLPPEVERVETRFGSDHTGDPAVYVNFHIRMDVKLGREEIKRLSRFSSAVASALYKGDIGGFAYTRLDQAA